MSAGRRGEGLLAGPLRRWRRRRRRDRLVAQGLRAIPPAARFDRLFPEALHFVNRDAGGGAGCLWYSRAGLAGRYLLVMQLPVRLDDSGASVTGYGDPGFSLCEVRSIRCSADGQLHVAYGAGGPVTGRQWAEFVRRRGDPAALGVGGGPAVPGFEQHWREI